MDSPYSASASPSSTNTGSPPSVPVPYYRSDSTVVEKPSHNYEAPEIYSVMNGENSRVEVLVIDQSQPTCNSAPQSPGSGCSSNKTTDDEGDNEGELDEGFCDELCDEGFAQLLVPDDPSDSAMIPTSTLLEDFDLGVDMFDSTEQTIPTSEPLKSPFGHVPMGPGSPYQLVDTSTSPVPIPPQDIQSQNDYNEYLNHSHSNTSGSPAYSQHSGYMPTADEDDLAMLLCDDMTGGGLSAITSTQSLMPPISSCGQHTSACSTMAMDFTSHPVSYASSSFTSHIDPSFATPTLTSVHMNEPSLMDLAEASQLALTGDGINTSLMNMATGQLEGTPIINSSSDSAFSSSVNISVPLSSVTNSVAGAQMCSRSSQTHQNNNRLTRSLSPAPSHVHQVHSPVSYHRQSHSPSPSPRTNHYSTSSVGSSSSGACYYTPSPDSGYLKGTSISPSLSKSSGKQSPIPLTKDKIVDMPFYQFKKILDDPSVDTNEKEQAKNIRKRGKNKVAAKNCRQKKIEVVMGLQQEVDSMKEKKKRLDMKCQGLEREINQMKQRCSKFRSLAYSS